MLCDRQLLSRPSGFWLCPSDRWKRTERPWQRVHCWGADDRSFSDEDAQLEEQRPKGYVLLNPRQKGNGVRNCCRHIWWLWCVCILWDVHRSCISRKKEKTSRTHYKSFFHVIRWYFLPYFDSIKYKSGFKLFLLPPRRFTFLPSLLDGRMEHGPFT